MSQLALEAELEQQAVLNSARRVTESQQISQQLQAANELYALKQIALQQELAALDKSGKDYELKLKQMLDRQKQLQRQHENEVTAVKDQAEINRNQRILAAENNLNNALAQSATSMLMRHQTVTQSLLQLGDQLVAGMMENAIKSALADNFTKEKDAAAAARKAYIAGMQFPFPVNLVAAPVLAAPRNWSGKKTTT